MDANCHVEPVEKAITIQQLRDADRALLSVGGMGCSNCAKRVRNSLTVLDGVYRADVYLNIALAEIYYDSRKLSTNALIDAVHRAGADGQHEYNAMLIAAD
jgi:copper chaperone CopZ